jgi:ubiquinone/menaquinone biosynthesis C-methylase UbiE
MRKEWNDRAAENARYYVATGQDRWKDEEFFRSGRIWIENHILPELPLISATREIRDMRVLEIGCGAGRMTRGLSEMFGFVDAMDVSETMIAEARVALADRSNVAFHVVDGVSLKPLPDDQFDFVFSAIVFQHIPRKWIVQNYINDAARLLKRELCIQVPGPGRSH